MSHDLLSQEWIGDMQGEQNDKQSGLKIRFDEKMAQIQLILK